MDSEVKFKAKDIDNNWVYGDLIHGVEYYSGSLFILPPIINLAGIPHCHPLNGVNINKDTLCQFIGIKDYKGKDVYEWDIITPGLDYYLVYYNKEKCGFALKPLNSKSKEDIPIEFLISESRVIGNKFDNPEYLSK